MAHLRPPHQLASNAFLMTVALVACWVAAAFYIILH